LDGDTKYRVSAGERFYFKRSLFFMLTATHGISGGLRSGSSFGENQLTGVFGMFRGYNRPGTEPF
jgi:hypothetical protein